MTTAKSLLGSLSVCLVLAIFFYGPRQLFAKSWSGAAIGDFSYTQMCRDGAKIVATNDYINDSDDWANDIIGLADVLMYIPFSVKENAVEGDNRFIIEHDDRIQFIEAGMQFAIGDEAATIENITVENVDASTNTLTISGTFEKEHLSGESVIPSFASVFFDVGQPSLPVLPGRVLGPSLLGKGRPIRASKKMSSVNDLKGYQIAGVPSNTLLEPEFLFGEETVKWSEGDIPVGTQVVIVHSSNYGILTTIRDCWVDGKKASVVNDLLQVDEFTYSFSDAQDLHFPELSNAGIVTITASFENHGSQPLRNLWFNLWSLQNGYLLNGDFGTTASGRGWNPETRKTLSWGTEFTVPAKAYDNECLVLNPGESITIEFVVGRSEVSNLEIEFDAYGTVDNLQTEDGRFYFWIPPSSC